MKKLNEIPKKEIFGVPDGYFDDLPSRIQARIEGIRPQTAPAFVFRYRLQYVVPVAIVVALAALWIISPRTATDVETVLASIETEQLVAYLQDTEVNTEDILQQIEFSYEEIDEIETEVYDLDFTEEDLDILLDLDSI